MEPLLRPVPRSRLRLAVPVLAALAAAPSAARGQAGPGCVRTGELSPRARGDTALREGLEDIRRGAVFRCVLRRGQAPVRMVLRTDRTYDVPVDVQLFRPFSAARPAQVLVLDDANGPPDRGRPYFVGVDLNRDGWMDLQVHRMSGATGNELFDVFLYDPAARRFAKDALLSKIGRPDPVAGRPCVRSGWNSGSGMWDGAEYCWRGGRWVMVRTESVQAGVRTVRELRAGRLRTIRVDTLPAPD